MSLANNKTNELWSSFMPKKRLQIQFLIFDKVNVTKPIA